MSVVFITFDTATGVILSRQSALSSDNESWLRSSIQANQPSYDVFEAPDMAYDGMYMRLVEGAWELADKEELTATWDKTSVTSDGVDEAILSPLPVPCTVYLDDSPITVEDGSFEFTADSAGSYRVTVVAPAWLAKTWMVDANV